MTSAGARSARRARPTVRHPRLEGACRARRRVQGSTLRGSRVWMVARGRQARFRLAGGVRRPLGECLARAVGPAA
jgi:hypothetical protein